MKQSLSVKVTFISVMAILVAMTSGLISTYLVNNSLADYNANNRMLVSARRNCEPVNNSLLVTETVVKGAKQIAESLLTKDNMGDDAVREEKLAEIDQAFGNLAKPVDFLCTYWLVCEPSLSGVVAGDGIPGRGFFKVRPVEEDTFKPHEVTNILNYQESDRENVIWWYETKDSASPKWLEPYYNANIDQNMFTYAIPLFDGTTFLGIIGADLQWNEIISDATSITDDFDNRADAFLLSAKDDVLYHHDFTGFDEVGHFKGTGKIAKDVIGDTVGVFVDEGIYKFPYNGDSRTACTVILRNGMKYGISVPTNVLFESSFQLTIIPLIVYLSVTVLLGSILFFTVRHYFRPIKELNDAVRAVRDGDLTVSIKKQSDDEIGELTDSFEAMVSALLSERAAMSALAFQDGLTGVKNKTAYEEKVGQINDIIASGEAKFAVIMCDVDNLKSINDTSGHVLGDKAIRAVCLAICRAFAHSPVYRIGGDEFVAIALDDDYENRHELFKGLLARRNSEEFKDFSFSTGMATYHPGVDLNFASVFARADEKMYQHKKQTKKKKALKKGGKEGKE